MSQNSKRILDCISSPADLHLLGKDELEILASEIRDQIVSTTSETGGHVASSLGAVEIILACHSVLDAPKDKIVFDVGHQSYAHKLVTGRQDAFSTLRSYGGLSGFPKPSESEFDVHPSGHASDSLSVAAGLAKAKQIRGSDERIIAIIGDAALAGGMAFEALNYIGSQQLPMVIILNDNEMSISRNVGALMLHLGNMRSTRGYRETRDYIQDRMESGGALSNAFAELGRRMKDSAKHMIIPESMIYEQLGIVCTPPIDGNSIADMIDMLNVVLPMDEPVLIHAVTKKGAGYAPAEEDPVRFHGVGPYDLKTGAAKPSSSKGAKYTDVFGTTLLDEAAADDSIVAITAAMEGGTGLARFHEAYPDRFIDVGIAEEHAVGMASGLAAAGLKPVVAVYSTFMQRAIDQVIVDVALANRDVVLALDRAGLVGDDGPTHHGVFDISYLRMIPNMRILVPSGAQELASSLHTALSLGGPVAIRYPRGQASDEVNGSPELLPEGKALKVHEGDHACILSWGRMLEGSLEAARQLEAEGIKAAVYDMRWAKPIDIDAVRDAASTGRIVTVEEGQVTGGAGDGVLEILAQLGLKPSVRTLGLPDEFAMQGDVKLLLADAGLDAASIANAIRSM
ncbi:MAG: 1-deoxy-D-xylulose-5-phosphate synthase [Eggerthellaceae bacterium]|nr:1-deoxy-D-xylulose-5-phosphate synthase [Eggerthellaceae bacterium]